MSDVRTEITPENFKAFTSNGPAIIEFYNYNCSVCLMQYLDTVRSSKKWAGKVAFGMCRVKVNRKLMKESGVRGTPTFVTFKNGEKLALHEGLHDTAELDEIMEGLLKDAPLPV